MTCGSQFPPHAVRQTHSTLSPSEPPKAGVSACPDSFFPPLGRWNRRWLLLGCILLLGCSRPPAPSSPLEATEPFTDITQSTGLDFVHFNGMAGEWYICEMMGPGGAFFDSDNDGDLDVLIVQGQLLGPGKTMKDALFPPRGPLPPRARLFRNDLVADPDGKPTIRFNDVTEQSKIDARGYGLGVATGDFDNDGRVDLYTTNLGSNQLWKNIGDGTYRDVTQQTGTEDDRFSTSAAFLDYDRDGWLDLYVCSYVHFDVSNHKPCYGSNGGLDYCGPLSYEPVPDRLFRNRGDGTFEDVSVTSGIIKEYWAALGVVCGDFNQDGWIDVYVANDGSANQLWINQRNGKFEDHGLGSGSALNSAGQAEASMGVDAGDFDNDGDEDLFMTHLRGETNTLYVNSGKGWFGDQSAQSRLGPPSKPYTAFGTSWIDYDNDGWLDVLTVNGEVRRVESLARQGDSFPFSQEKQLFRNLANGKFEDVSRQSGAAFQLAEVGRGAAFGDVDNDGDVDVLVLNNNGPARLLLNNVGNRNHWIGLGVLHSTGRDAIGARVAVSRSEGPALCRRVRTAASYCSANDPRILVGLGRSSSVRSVRIEWLGGRVEEWTNLSVDRYHTLREGTGQLITSPEMMNSGPTPFPESNGP